MCDIGLPWIQFSQLKDAYQIIILKLLLCSCIICCFFAGHTVFQGVTKSNTVAGQIPSPVTQSDRTTSASTGNQLRYCFSLGYTWPVSIRETR